MLPLDPCAPLHRRWLEAPSPAPTRPAIASPNPPHRSSSTPPRQWPIAQWQSFENFRRVSSPPTRQPLGHQLQPSDEPFASQLHSPICPPPFERHSAPAAFRKVPVSLRVD